MLGRVNHIAIAVPILDEAAAIYRDTLGAKVSAPQTLPQVNLRTTVRSPRRRAATPSVRCARGAVAACGSRPAPRVRSSSCRVSRLPAAL